VLAAFNRVYPLGLETLKKLVEGANRFAVNE